MAGRTADISTSSFKPLDLNEIMMVPLALQQKEDNTMLALDELSQLESQALAQDQGYISGQAGALRNEANAISDELISGGINSSITNKMLNLRKRKNKEFSLEGKTGQAAQAFAKYEANKKAINARKDLTEEQKTAGLQESLNKYAGVVEGGSYEDYQGASYVDIGKKGREMLKSMTPSEQIAALGYEDNGDGTFSDGTYIHKELTADHISQVVEKALRGDRAGMNYLKEVERLGLGSIDEMIRDAANTAGNIGQVNVQKNPSWRTKGVRATINNKTGIVDPGQAWSKNLLFSGEEAFNKTLGLKDDFAAKGGFNEDGTIKKYDEEYTGKKYTTKYYGNNADSGGTEVMTGGYKRWLDRDVQGSETTKAIAKLRLENPNQLEGLTDREVYDAYQESKVMAAKAYSEVIKPYNVKNAFYQFGDKITGTATKHGDYSSRGIKILGQTGVGGQVKSTTIASQLEPSMTMEEFDAAMKQGSLMGMLPGDPDLPMGNVIQIKNGDKIHTLILGADTNMSERYPDASLMMKTMMDGKSSAEGVGGVYLNKDGKKERFNKYYINHLNPKTRKYELKMIRGTQKFNKQELDSMTFEQDEFGSFTGNVTVNGVNFGNIQVSTYEDVVNTAIKGVTRMYDETRTKN